MNRQRLILFILLAVLALSIGYSFWRMPRQEKAPAGTAVHPQPVTKTSTRQKGEKGAVPQDKFVRLDLLECPKAGFTGFRKDIFKPIFRDESKVPQPPPMLPKPVPPPLPPRQVVVPPPVASIEPPPVVRDMARFTFLGYLKKDNKKTVFLTKEKQILLVHQGDKIEGKYEVTSVTDTALSIRVLGDGSEIVIPLVENKPLNVQMR